MQSPAARPARGSFKSPQALSAGKQALHCYRKKKHRIVGVDLTPVRSSETYPAESPLPPSLAALLSSRIDRYRRLTPDLAAKLTRQMESPARPLHFDITTEEKRDIDKENKITQASFLAQVLEAADDPEEAKQPKERFEAALKRAVEMSFQVLEQVRSSQVKEGTARNAHDAAAAVQHVKALYDEAISSISTTLRWGSCHDTPLEVNSAELESLTKENTQLKEKLSLFQSQVQHMQKETSKASHTHTEVVELQQKCRLLTHELEEKKALVDGLRESLTLASLEHGQESIDEITNTSQSSAQTEELPNPLTDPLPPPIYSVQDLSTLLGSQTKSDYEVLHEKCLALAQKEIFRNLAIRHRQLEWDQFKSILSAHSGDTVSSRKAWMYVRGIRSISPTHTFTSNFEVDMLKIDCCVEASFAGADPVPHALHDFIGYLSSDTLIEERPESATNPDPKGHSPQPTRLNIPTVAAQQRETDTQPQSSWFGLFSPRKPTRRFVDNTHHAPMIF